MNTSLRVINDFANTGHAGSYFHYSTLTDSFEEWLASGKLEEVIGGQLVNPENARVVTINKVPGMQEEMEAAAAQRLVDRKAAMSEEEIEQTVAATREYNEWTVAVSAVSMINEVNVLTVEELPEELRTSQVTVTDRNGVRYADSVVENDELVDISLYFRADWVPVDQLQRYGEVAQLLGQVRTGSHTVNELTVLRNEYGITFTAECLTDGADSSVFIPVLTAKISCLREDTAEAIALVQEIMSDTQFDEYDTIRYLGLSLTNTMKLYPSILPHYLIRGIALAAADSYGLYNYYMGDLPYFAYLDRLVAMDDAAMAEEGTALKALLDGLYNREGLKVTVVSDAEGIQNAEALLDTMSGTMPYSARNTVSYAEEMEKLPKNIAVKITGSSCYNIKLASMSEIGYSYTPELDILDSLVYDQILIPTLRYRNGVYSTLSSVDESSVYILAYRDPSPTKTYDEVIPTIAEQISGMTVDEAALNNLIISGYTALAQQSGPITTAQNAAKDVLCNTSSQQVKLRRMHAYKGLTPEKLLSFAGIYDALSEEGVTVTAAPSSVIDAHADRYDLVITWYLN